MPNRRRESLARDTQKIIRAIEMRLVTGKTVGEIHRSGRDPLAGYEVIKIGLLPPRAALYERIHARVEAMIRAGWIDEVRQLVADGVPADAKPFQFIGYAEWREHLAGRLGKEEAVLRIQQATRNFAKRQITWFRKESAVHWLEGFGDDPEIICGSSRQNFVIITMFRNLTACAHSSIVPRHAGLLQGEHMASAPALKSSPLQPDDWIRAAFARLSTEGIESVRIELLARDLGVSKGSFYWHFQDREELLAKMLDRWEGDEIEWLGATVVTPRAAARWAQFIEHCADPGRARVEAALRAWARRDERVASRISSIEKKRTKHIASVLRDIGFTPELAESWAEIALLVYLGWLDRATRDLEFQVAGRSLSESLSDLIFAASDRSTPTAN